MFNLRKKICILAVSASLLLTGCGSNLDSGDKVSYDIDETKTYEMTDTPVVNPYSGFAVDATKAQAVGDNSLVYIDITFKELQPNKPDEFAFDSIDAQNNVALWREQGKTAVLRFVCDVPSGESHSDIPDWLMKLTGDGAYYTSSIGSGYTPDYSNETFIQYHKAAMDKLAEHYNDGFISYVELGTLGHNGTWHIEENAGSVKMPDEKTRRRYLNHYKSAFEGTKLLLSKPFRDATSYKCGLYNDYFGSEELTNDWLDKVTNGGAFHEAGEPNGLIAYPEFWKNLPSGGDIAASSKQSSYTNNLDTTIEQLKSAHTTYLGPETPFSADGSVGQYQTAVDKIRSTIGYRLGVSQVKIKRQQGFDSLEVALKWSNNGTASVYFDFPVALYIRNTDGSFEKISDVTVDLSKSFPEKAVHSTTFISTDKLSETKDLYVGVSTPGTEDVGIKLVSNQESVGNYYKIYTME